MEIYSNRILLNVLYIVLFFVGVWAYPKISKKIKERPLYTKIKNSKLFEETKQNLKSFIGFLFTIAFVVTLVMGFSNYIETLESNGPLSQNFSSFILTLALTGLTLGTFSIAIASFSTQIKKSDLTKNELSETLAYKQASSNLITSGIFFVYAYFFWITKNFIHDISSQFYTLFIGIYTLLMYGAILIGALILIITMKKLLDLNRD